MTRGDEKDCWPCREGAFKSDIGHFDVVREIHTWKVPGFGFMFAPCPSACLKVAMPVQNEGCEHEFVSVFDRDADGKQVFATRCGLCGELL